MVSGVVEQQASGIRSRRAGDSRGEQQAVGVRHDDVVGEGRPLGSRHRQAAEAGDRKKSILLLKFSFPP
jgi:hypothetical protein